MKKIIAVSMMLCASFLCKMQAQSLSFDFNDAIPAIVGENSFSNTGITLYKIPVPANNYSLRYYVQSGYYSSLTVYKNRSVKPYSSIKRMNTTPNGFNIITGNAKDTFYLAFSNDYGNSILWGLEVDTMYSERGESFENPFSIYEGKNILSSGNYKVKWCKYVFPENGSITVRSSSQYIYAYKAKPAYSSDVWSDNENFSDANLLNLGSLNYSASADLSQLKVNGKAGDAIYIKIMDDYNTSAQWQLFVTFHKARLANGTDARTPQPITIGKGDYPLLNYYENSFFSFFSFTPTVTGKYQLSVDAQNAWKWSLMTDRQVWDPIIGEPFVFNALANNTYVFGIGSFAGSNKITFSLENADKTKPLSLFSNNITPFTLNKLNLTKLKDNPSVNYAYKAEKNGVLQIIHPYRKSESNLVTFFADKRHTSVSEYVQLETLNDAIFVNKDDSVYLHWDSPVDTFSWFAKLYNTTDFLKFKSADYDGKGADVTIDYTNHIVKATFPYNELFSSGIKVDFSLVDGSKAMFANETLTSGSSIYFTKESDTTITVFDKVGNSQAWTLQVRKYSLASTAKIFTQFFIESVQIGIATIDNANKKITAKVEWSKNVSLTARCNISPRASSDKLSGTDDLKYMYLYFDNDSDSIAKDSVRVVAEDGTENKYYIEVTRVIPTVGMSCATPIIASTGINSGNWPISAVFSYKCSSDNAVEFSGADSKYNYLYVLNGCPATSSKYFYLSPESKYAKRCKKGEIIYFYFEQKIKTFTIKEIPVSTEKEVISVNSMSGEYMLDKPNRTVWLNVPANSSANIYAKVSEGAEIWKDSVKQEYSIYVYSFPDSFEVMAMDSSKVTWYIKNYTKKEDTRILSFTLPNQVGATQIDSVNKKITCFVDKDVPLGNLIASFALSSGANAYVNGIQQYAGFTKNDFNKPLNYSIRTANDSVAWIVDVKNAGTAYVGILDFNIHGQFTSPNIDFPNKTIKVKTLPYVDVKQLRTYFTITPGASAIMNSTTISSDIVIDYSSEVSINVTNGVSSNLWKIYVSPMEKACQAGFTYTISKDTVRFVNTSTGGEIYYWNFGDNMVTQMQNPMHKFKTGTYNVSLTVYNSETECLDTYTERITIGTVSCEAVFSFVVKPLLKQVTFTNTSKGNKYFWAFDDGTYSEEPNPIKTYNNKGVYKVSLIATNADMSCKDMVTKIVSVGDSCSAAFSYFADTSKNMVSLYSNYNKPLLRHLWEMSDGSISNEPNPIIAVPAKGYYTVSHTVLNPLTLCADKVKEVIQAGASNDDCFANFTFLSSDTGVVFINRSKGNLKGYIWNFGDNTNKSSKENPTHQYNKEGLFNVCLTVINDKNITNTACKKVSSAPLSSNCEADFNYFVDNETYSTQFINRSSGSPERYYWGFGDSNSSAVLNPQNTYSKAGDYLVSLKITSLSSTCYDEAYKLINVGTPGGMRVVFITKPQNIALKAGGYPVDFIGAGLGDQAKLKWDFGDGQTDSTTTSPTHEYAEPGTYTVCYIVEDPITGDSSQYCEEVIVTKDSEIETTSIMGMKVYPMPFDNQINIVLEGVNDGMYSLDLFDLSGRRVDNVVNKISSANKIVSYNGSNLPVGSYILKASSSSGTTSILIIKK